MVSQTFPDLTSRMDSVKEDNLVLKSENQVLSQYIENVMQASAAFQQLSPKSRKRCFALPQIWPNIYKVRLLFKVTEWEAMNKHYRTLLSQTVARIWHAVIFKF